MLNQPNLFDCHPLFDDVQMQQVFPDGKTFVDCIPKQSTAVILQQYTDQKDTPGFNLKNFVLANFELPGVFAADYTADANNTTAAHINDLWQVLTRQPDASSGSLIPLPHPYIVPGGRFGEVYYWDSYFTMLGLKVSGRNDMVKNMVANFSHLIKAVGFIPNGNRTYYLGRSQPPFYSLMVQLLATIKGKNILAQYLPTLEKEYQYWMKGADELNEANTLLNHSVRMKDGEILNRYCDAFDTARPESYRQDIELAHQSTQEPTVLYKHLRAGAESGWDYSSRWFKDGQSFSTIHTAGIVPVDLNCLLYHLEQTIAEAYHLIENNNAAKNYTLLAEKRKQAIQKYCWNDTARFFVDYDVEDNVQKQELTLAGVTPLYFRIASQEQADLTAEILQSAFLKPGGLVTSLKQTGQQWDAPNGWAPLQWMAVAGLENYSHHSLAANIAKRWVQLNTDVYNRTGKLMEKYNVEDTHLEAGGGEYEGQDGFGWTNGVYLALKEKYAL
ncbi:MAG: alpha,alpha-trehalase TreF [Chitinophagaceae bacterium]|nr:alpha,alpha-trehalase TreF [Chitinophagaceae bacterium]